MELQHQQQTGIEGADLMSTTHDPPISGGPGQPPAPRSGPGGPGGPHGPSGHGGGGEDPGNPARRFRLGLLAAAAVAVIGLGTVFGLEAAGIGYGDRALTTSQIATQVRPELADVVATLGDQDSQQAGTGIVLTPSGEVLTNNHVIAGATSVKVTDVGNGRTYPATVVGYDRSHDIALLQLRGASGLSTVTLGDSSTAKAGQKVVALGNAGGQGGTPSVATGRITGLGASITASEGGTGTGITERLTRLIRNSADIQPGDSGGPLVNTAGQVIGINTAASTNLGFHFQIGYIESFAIPIDQAASIGGQIAAGAPSATVHIGGTAMLGVEIMSAYNAAATHPGAAGPVVAGTAAGSPAGKAGLRTGDVIVSVDGRRISSPAALQSALERHHPGDRIRIGWTDTGGRAHSAAIVLAAGPAA